MNIAEVLFSCLSFFSAALCAFACSAFPAFVTVYRLFAVGSIVIVNSRSAAHGYQDTSGGGYGFSPMQ